ncbi:MAG: hypothetical protein JXA41_12895 [Deltaproteobacteria bacterium]|nr:hypothetical protein [Deltaproteobacteria bacterium]
MYECRCPHDGKKLAEIARPTLDLKQYDYPCECGRWVRAQMFIENESDCILSVSSCPCGRASRKVVGYVVMMQCPKCKAFIKF